MNSTGDAKLIVATAFVAGVIVGLEAGLVYAGSLWTALLLAGMYLLGLLGAGVCRASADDGDDICLNGEAE